MGLHLLFFSYCKTGINATSFQLIRIITKLNLVLMYDITNLTIQLNTKIHGELLR